MSAIQYVLALDTALSGCSVAIYDVVKDLHYHRSTCMVRGQAEALVPMIDDVLNKAELKYKQLGLVAVTLGPGAFTGLRIGLSTAKALGLSLGIPVAGLTSLEILAYQFFNDHSLNEDQKLFVVLETKRKDFYFQSYGFTGDAEAKPQALKVEDLLTLAKGHDVICIGDAFDRLQCELPKDYMFELKAGFNLPDPCLLARLTFEFYKKGHLKNVEPLYLRPADVSQSKQVDRIIADE